MAGDHKCPVCNSTFTRPQHVARHMRSHTGDRPYKCQHCGDQFARSDLLSRHVNKCHASEKPPTTTTPNNRRKGPTAASRATTSKQACDQCVQSSLPCDGCNPCSKCVQRKCRCTYVKFHRQTAPQGPGHPPPSVLPPHHPHAHHARTSSTSTSASAASSSRIPDDFVLAPPPGTANLSAIYAQNQHGHLPHQYTSADYVPYGAYGQRESPTSGLTGPGTTRDPSSGLVEGGSPDLMARYRPQSDLYRNPTSGLGMGVGSIQSIVGGSGILPNSTILPPPHSSSTVLPAIYDPHHLDHRYGGTTGWSHSFQTDKGRDYGPPGGERLSFSAGGGGGGGGSSTHSSSVQTHPSTQQTVQPHQNIGTNQQHPQQHSQHSPHLGHVHPPHGSPQFTNDVQKQYDQQRQFSREHHQYNQFAGSGSERQHDAFPALSSSLPFPLNSRKEMSGSDFNNIDSFGSDGSVSSSAGSSNMQFPLMDRSRSRIFAFDTHDGVLGKEGLLGDGAGTGLAVGGIGEGGFSSAFGLMSLDDPNVLAGLATDGTPFFTKVEGENTCSLSKRSSVSEGAGSTTDASMSDKGSEDTSNTSLSSSNDNSANASTTSLGLGGNLATPGSREMREFWRQYMRTPLTGPGASTPLFGSLLTPTASGNHLQLGAGLVDDGRPAPPPRRHSRVASLPSLKTPTPLGLSEYGIFIGINNNDTAHHQGQGLSSYLQPPTFQLNLGGATKKYKDSQQQQREQEQDTQPSPGQTNHRGTIYDKEDLKSYEQAVLARRGVTELKIVPRRRGTVASGAPSASVNANAYSAPPPISNRPSTADAATNSNRSASSTASKGSTSSLAEAFGRSGSASVVSAGESSGSSVSPPLRQSTIPASSTSQGSHGDRDSPTPSAGPRMGEHSPLLGAPSRVPAHQSSSHDSTFLSPAVSHQGTGDSQGSYRPSFKRLASQTLGPDNAKRALLGPAGWEEEEYVVDDEEESSEDDHYVERDRRTAVSQQAKFVQESRPMRRMSCPTTARSPSSLVLPPIQAGGSVPGRRPSGAGYP